MKKQTKEILDYYEYCETDYYRFWDLQKSMAMHAGFWDETTNSLRQALARENEVIAQLSGIKRGMRVLDAGCGVGGTSLYLASEGCSVDGITISPHQLERAREFASTVAVEKRPRYHLMDYTAMAFLDATFDVVVAIESVCHAEDKQAFIKEANRVLKPGGILIVADGFLIKEGEGMDMWMKGWAVGELATIPGFQVALKRGGFKLIETIDATARVMPSSKRLYWIALATHWLSKMGEKFGLRTPEQTANIHAAYWHHKTLAAGLWGYYILLSSKV